MSFLITTKLLLLISVTVLCGCGKPITSKSSEAATVETDTLSVVKKIDLLGTSMEANFNNLPLFGEIRDQRKYWSGDYWKHNKGSINFRWYSSDPKGFDLISPGREEARSMGAEAIKGLSPAEKYDLLTGRYDYPLKKEISKLARKSAKDWEGLCHGWAPASLNHPEPESRSLVNPDGIEVPFGSSDIKALLTYYYAYNSGQKSQQIGKRCYQDPPVAGVALVQDGEDTCDEDLDAAQFHIVLANKIGIEGESFLADIDRYREVWNHPIVTYSSKILRETQEKNLRFLIIQTTIYYVDEIAQNSWSPTIGTNDHITTQRVYEYQLEVGQNGKLLRGKWLSKERPDFLWTLQRPKKFTGYLARLEELSSPE